ncbi:Peptidase family M28 [Flavobacterium fluvii]|uniref:Vacuolar membrane protease n=1 Tax=Flavobacterium fluvii TaxID=468056 RepID=A0A1M5F9H4_9FLAO|nr:M28 family peptidase [Flavobacterium fluvii]SHF87742.1 Peptidase family M28 [Flavobacterium fluvii]
MKKSYSSISSVLFLLGMLGFIFFTMMPQWTSDDDAPLSEFSTKRALEQVKNISQKPHFVGSQNHDVVANYLVKELQNMGLQTSIQEGYSFSDWGTLTKCKNILARIKGSNNGKALLLLSHYDSAPHSYSKGASDAGSGVATILESVRAFVYNKKQPKTDIIILFSDAEELGLNGAALFVTQHNWAKEVGLVLNFEARGSSGPSYMLMETNAGNAGLVKEFAAANAQYPVSNSLMYSVYKMLPNDTDLTVFREQGNIQGYNFAFIDGHYNYHTEQDDLNHLDKNTLAHQGKYLMPLLDYFSNADLNSTQATEDDVYFSIPFTFISYPFSWVLPMVILAFVLLLFLLFLGFAKRILSFPEIGKGFIPFLGSLITAGLITFLGWKLLLLLYPQYNDLLNGFTYNGHDYIAAFTLLTLSICFAFYQRFSAKKVTLNHYVAPLFLWILINGLLAFFLKGAGFLIIPAFAGLLMLASFVLTQRSKWILNLFLSIPALLLIAPFIQMFPIGLGLKILFGSAILTVFTFGLLLPVFGSFVRKGMSSVILLVLAICFFAKAHYYSGYELGKAKSNSLVYILDADKNKATWATYDTNLDEWTKNYLGQNPRDAKALSSISLPSKYKTGFTFTADAPIKALSRPIVEFLKDSVVGANRYLKIRITPTRKVNRYDVFAHEALVIQNFKANGLSLLGQKGSKYERKGKKLLSYYVVDQLPLEIEFSVAASSVLDLDLMESSFDLMNNPLFSMTKRADWMMPTPFVLNDAVIIKQKIKTSAVRQIPLNPENTIQKDSLGIVKDSLRKP